MAIFLSGAYLSVFGTQVMLASGNNVGSISISLVLWKRLCNLGVILAEYIVKLTSVVPSEWRLE